mmetsp:Transcript_28459/g.37895  ORF Transcript_28459/g.37895 Transcript_28459/m.37895 type:complete len:144 (-) Transcript_28459:3142-3573(-)
MAKIKRRPKSRKRHRKAHEQLLCIIAYATISIFVLIYIFSPDQGARTDNDGEISLTGAMVCVSNTPNTVERKEENIPRLTRIHYSHDCWETETERIKLQLLRRFLTLTSVLIQLFFHDLWFLALRVTAAVPVPVDCATRSFKF